MKCFFFKNNIVLWNVHYLSFILKKYRNKNLIINYNKYSRFYEMKFQNYSNNFQYIQK